jgi:LPPG:FO 2-phospho-L-lactate transferase
MRICMLCGGVGGARAALALSESLPAESLTLLVNTGDDFRHLGLEIWPDWDTVVYTLSGLGDAARGWGRADEGTRCMEELARLQGPTWFHLGDRDLALHVYREWALRQGQSATAVAAAVARSLGVAVRVLRLTEGSLGTRFALRDGSAMDFQSWFVRHQGRPEVASIEIPGASGAVVTAGVLEAIAECDLLMIAPSNPYLSIFPMLAVEPVAAAVRARRDSVWAVSPLIGGKAVKGPLDALIAQLSASSGQQAVADALQPWAHTLLLPAGEQEGVQTSLRLLPCRTLLGSRQARAEFGADLQALWSRR